MYGLAWLQYSYESTYHDYEFGGNGQINSHFIAKGKIWQLLEPDRKVSREEVWGIDSENLIKPCKWNNWRNR